MSSHYKIITVIIATHNAAQTLGRCLDSFLLCDTSKIEIIIKDYNSTDRTQSIAKSYTQNLRLRFISIPDSGIYDAWNQALEQDGGVLGSWVLFMGADDFICSPQRMNVTIAALQALPEEIDYASAPVTLVSEQGFAVDTLFPSRDLERDLPAGMPLPHQGLFHRSKLFTTNRFDASLRITGDYEFLCRTLTPNNLAYLDIPAPVCMSLGGVSGNLTGMAKRNCEALRVSKHFFPAHNRNILWKRLALSYLFRGIDTVCGTTFAAACADYYRKMLGKPLLWGTNKSLPASLRLPQPVNTADQHLQPTFSLLVATIARVEPLAKLLDSLLHQSVAADTFEVLIADQNPPGFLQAVIDTYSQQLRIQVVQVPNKGVSQARNALLPLAKGQYVAFPDDDCFYDPDTLSQAQRIFESHLHVHAVQGSWSAPDCAHSKDNAPNTFRTWLSIFLRGETYVQFYRKEAVDCIGLFDPIIGPGTGLPYGCGEDTDYLLRAIKAGLTVLYAPKVHVRHKEVDPQCAAHNKDKVCSYATGRMYLLHKHGLPLWFQIVTVVYPLLLLCVEGSASWQYRLTMFKARLKGFFFVRSGAAPKP